MRYFVYTLYILSFLALGFGLRAHAANMSAKTDCDSSLQQRMTKDPKVEGTCSATVKVDGVSATKTFHASIKMENGTASGLLLREVCESCKTTGPVETQALDYRQLANWALAKAGQSLAKGENVSSHEESSDDEDEDPSSEVSVDACAAKSNATDRMSCRISTLNVQTDVHAMRDYYLKTVQPDLQKLATSKKDADKDLLRRSVLTMLTTANGATESDLAIKSSVYEFRSFIELRQFLAMNPSPIDRQMLQAKYETIFRDRPTYNKHNGVDVESLHGNSRLLMKLVKEEVGATSDKSIASANGPTASSTPRDMFGRQGLQQGRGFTPPRTSPGSTGASGGLDRIFNRN